MAKLIVTEQLLRELENRRVSFWPKVSIGQKVIYRNQKFEEMCIQPSRAFLPLGSFSYANGTFGPCKSIGRYCSISSDVAVFGDSHPTDWVSSSPVFYRSDR